VIAAATFVALADRPARGAGRLDTVEVRRGYATPHRALNLAW
jgi:hypothetical protein